MFCELQTIQLVNKNLTVHSKEETDGRKVT